MQGWMHKTFGNNEKIQFKHLSEYHILKGFLASNVNSRAKFDSKPWTSQSVIQLCKMVKQQINKISRNIIRNVKLFLILFTVSK